VAQDHDKTWAEMEFGGAPLGDPRLTKRLVLIAEKLANHPQGSLPQACGTWDHLKGAYRFFSNARVTEHQILEPHFQATQKRAEDHVTVLAVQDTTQLDFTHHPATTGLGMMQDPDHHGLFYHPTLLLTPERVPLGIMHHQIWTRPVSEFGKRHRRRQRPLEEKESQKWLHSLAASAQLQKELPQITLVNVADREADIYDCFLLARRQNIHLLVRAAWNRRVVQEHSYLWDYLATVPVTGHYTVEVAPRPGKKPRQAELAVRFAEVAIKPPKHRYQEKDLPPLTLWAIFAHEEQPPDGEEALSWMLLCTLVVQSYEEAREKLQWYTCRFQIEIYFKILKSGCRFEQLQLEAADRLRRCLAIYAVVAWRVLFLTMQSRKLPDIACDVLLETEEWQALYCVSHNTRQPSEKPPTLREATRMIAQLGGFLNRKRDGHPGPMTIWRGLQRLYDITIAWSLGRSP